MTTATPPTLTAADLCDRAADVIERNGFNQRHLYDDHQAAGGTPLPDCRVDLFGALNIADHGWPRYDGAGRTEAAERALQIHLGVGNLGRWNDAPERTQADVVQAFRETAAGLRKEAGA
ncbi:DUF6197 family protein [Streptomyces luteocolor]|uniref:DUF6197 family protein n=1 Tax=Streptomyces luteocolor TaxID=285500 RepID=UPI000853388F|nr:hypothetical protein [Streptomyces luteocolor]